MKTVVYANVKSEERLLELLENNLDCGVTVKDGVVTCDRDFTTIEWEIIKACVALCQQ